MPQAKPKQAALDAAAGTRSMYLRSLKLKNFRSCYETAVMFQPSLTLLVGENNSGKSNVIQALQLATSPLGGRRIRFFEGADISGGLEDATIELSLELAGPTDIQQAQYLSALDIDAGTVHYTTRFKLDHRGARYSKPTSHAGLLAGSDPEPEQREKIRHVYLAPLRDAQRELNSGDGHRLAQVIEHLFEKTDRDKFITHANEQLQRVGEHPVLKGTTTKIQTHLSGLTEPVRSQSVGISFRDHELLRLTRGLRMKMAEHGVKLSDLADSGLGYANLLYIATVVLELSNAAEAELTLFLVEEPEAHLHPQLQAVLLHYLKEQAEASGKDDSVCPAGRVQVICTTHSPNLASSVGIENAVVLRTMPQPDTEPPHATADGEAGESTLRPNTVSIAVANLGLDSDDLRKISRYLDVTKAALLFARRVLLVEGIAEALVLPSLARKCVYGTSSAEHERKRRDFSAVSLISVEGIDFKPYIQLLLTSAGPCSILDRLVIVTDGDPDLPELTDTPPRDQQPPPQGNDERDGDGIDSTEVARNRRDDLEAEAARLGTADRLKVFESAYTFEADLLSEGGEPRGLEGCLYSSTPKIGGKVDGDSRC